MASAYRKRESELATRKTIPTRNLAFIWPFFFHLSFSLRQPFFRYASVGEALKFSFHLEFRLQQRRRPFSGTNSLAVLLHGAIWKGIRYITHRQEPKRRRRERRRRNPLLCHITSEHLGIERESGRRFERNDAKEGRMRGGNKMARKLVLDFFSPPFCSVPPLF